MKSWMYAAAAAVLLSACATVTRGTTSQVQIRSEPSGALATTSLAHTCTTPCTLTVNRKDEFVVTFNLEGYQEQSVEVKTRIAGEGAAGFAGNVLVGGVVGMGVDAATGSSLEHVPNPISVILQKAVTAAQTPPRRTGTR
jgi:PEGA domain